MKAVGVLSVLIAVFALMVGCTTRHDARVEAVYALAATEPTEAIDSIAAIDTLTLTKSDRMLLQLAKIKATDKAYLDLPGDSVILPLVDYYSSHETDRFYAEALYYAGRIYSESGDSPNALRYFQDALDLLPENTPNKTLRGSVLSQTAGLLGRLHLIDEAIPYFEAVIKSDSLLQDTTNLIYDLADYAECLRWADRCDQALPLLNKALDLAQQTDSDFLPVINMYISRIYLKKGNYKTAHKYIIPALDNIEDGFRKDAMVSAIKSYYLNEKYDSAYNLARYVTSLKANESIISNAYYYLIQDELNQFISPDSLKAYRKKYTSLTESILKKYSDRTPIFQQAFYNYSVHDRERQRAEKREHNIFIGFLCALLCCVVFILLYLISVNKAKSNRIKLHEALDFIRKQEENNKDSKEQNVDDSTISTIDKSNEDIRQELRNYYFTHIAKIKELPEKLTNSPAIKTLKMKAEEGKGISTTNRIWRNFEKTFNNELPHFKKIVTQLAGKSLKYQEYITLMLIKCEFTPSEIASLVFRNNSTISYRRKELSMKLFGDNLKSENFYRIIRNI